MAPITMDGQQVSNYRLTSIFPLLKWMRQESPQDIIRFQKLTILSFLQMDIMKL
jgi:hypothetical protein